MLVSVITTCRNSASFLEACLQSVCEQDYPHLEHIVQDGASQDGTLEILERYRDRVDWVSEPDRCQADGLDRGLKRCRGDVILVLNADDVLLPGACAWAVEQMRRHPEAAVVYGDLYIINPHDEIIGAQFGPEPYSFEKVLCLDQVIPAQAAFFRRRHLALVGLGADAEMDTCPDYEMMVRIGSRFPMVHEPFFVAKYRWHPHPDGALPRDVRRFVAAKMAVMDRYFQAPDATDELRRQRRRAHAGLHQWAAVQAVIEGDGGGCLREMAAGAAAQPTPARLASLIRTAVGIAWYRMAHSGEDNEYQ